MATATDERKLLAKATAGDSAAQESLLLFYYERLSRHVAYVLPANLQPVMGVEDVLQKTFVNALRDFEKFKLRADGSFFAWLKSIADHRIKDAIRKQSRLKHGGGCHHVRPLTDEQMSSMVDLFNLISAGVPTASSLVARDEGVQALQVAIAGLPDDYRVAVQLRHLEGRSVEAVAEELGRTPDAVRGILQRSKEKLRGAIGRASLYFGTR